MKAYLHLRKLLLCVITATSICNFLHAQANKQDSLALVDIYNKTGGEYWFEKTNWLTKAPLSTWQGVGVAFLTGRVVSFSTTFGSVTSELPASIGNLTALNYLELVGDLTGNLPISIGNLINLKHLYVTGNFRSIPSSIGNLSQLEYLYIGGDLLSDGALKSLPSSIGNLFNLKELNLISNPGLTEIPSTIGNLFKLEKLSLEQNFSLTEMPSTIGNLTSLKELNLIRNYSLTEIPSTIGNLFHLQTLNINYNSLLTAIPSTIGNLFSLKALNLSDNNFNTTIPSFLGNLDNLEYLNLGSSKFIGSIPSSIGKLKKLKGLSFFNNHLEDPVPSSISNLTNLKVLEVEYNNFSYDGLETIGYALPNVYFYFTGVAKVNYLSDSILSVSAGGTLTNNTYTWSHLYYDTINNWVYWVADTTISANSNFNISWAKSDIIKVDVYNSVAKYCSFSSDTINLNLKIAFKNPNPSLLNDDASIKSDISNLSFENDVTGAATDGVTKLLLLAKSDVPLTFSLGSTKDGKLSSLTNQEQYENNIIANPINGKVAVIYTVPDGYGEEFISGGREVKIKVKNTNDDSTTVSLNLVTPPVVLVHGMWSKPQTAWVDPGFVNSLISAGYSYNPSKLASIYLADYSQYSASTFDPFNNNSMYGRNAIRNAISDALKNYHDNHIAVAQVDVVGHSLGGLMARSLSQESYFAIKTNYHKGYYHKLITLGTPHKGSPFGPLLYYNYATINLFSNQIIIPAPLQALMKIIHNDIGLCHKDFDENGYIIQNNLLATLPYCTYAIAGDYRGSISNNIEYDVFSSLIYILSGGKTHAELFHVDGCPNDEPSNDIIVPVYSQIGGSKIGQIFPTTAHLEIIPYTGETSETNSSTIQNKVIQLLLSDSSNKFNKGFIKASYINDDCDNTIITNKNLSSHNRAKISNSSIQNQAVQIVTPIIGSVYNQDSKATIKLQFTRLNGALPTQSIFMVEDIGWFVPDSSSTDSVSFILPTNTALGNKDIVLLVRDTTGIILGDTSHIVITADGTLDSISASPNPIMLDSVRRESQVQVYGYFKETNISTNEDINDGSTGTNYIASKGESIFKVSADGFITAIKPGIDTLQIQNNLKTTKVVVIVDSNFNYINKYPNVIDFPTIPNKVISDEPFVLNASTTSGEQVTYTLLSGPVSLNNGVVTINGIGTVTIQATAFSNAYFDNADPVTRTFQVVGTLFLSLTPESSSGPVNTNQCFTALVTDQDNKPIVNIGISFNVSGANGETNDFIYTNANGQSKFCYNGRMEGKDTIVATVGALTDTSYFTRISGPPDTTCKPICIIDSYKNRWNLCARETVSRVTVTGTVNMGNGMVWNAWGWINCNAGRIELHAINPQAANCASGYTDSFVYRGIIPMKCNMGNIHIGGGEWTSYCSGNVTAKGLVTAVNCGFTLPGGFSNDAITPARLGGTETIALKAVPNPAKNYVTISYKLAKESKVNIIVYDYLMQPVKTLLNSTRSAGDQAVVWNANNSKGSAVSSGFYKVVALVNGRAYSTTVQIIK